MLFLTLFLDLSDFPCCLVFLDFFSTFEGFVGFFFFFTDMFPLESDLKNGLVTVGAIEAGFIPFKYPLKIPANPLFAL